MKKLLVACECSQTITKAFRKLGYEAWSCDIKDTYGDLPQYHIKDDAIKIMQSDNWTMIIAHPPCKYLSRAASHVACPGGIYDEQRLIKTRAAAEFFYKFYSYDMIPYRVIENPIPFKIAGLPERNRQHIEPWQFGEPYTKATYLWLVNVCPLIPTYITKPICRPWVQEKNSDLPRQTMRSKTFNSIATAMAEQWGRRYLE